MCPELQDAPETGCTTLLAYTNSPFAFPAGVAKADAVPASGKVPAQRTQELLKNWHAVAAQQQRKASLDEHELLQHQMSQMRQDLGGMRFTSLEYGR
jgi:hypothetical protein